MTKAQEKEVETLARNAVDELGRALNARGLPIVFMAIHLTTDTGEVVFMNAGKCPPEAFRALARTSLETVLHRLATEA